MPLTLLTRTTMTSTDASLMKQLEISSEYQNLIRNYKSEHEKLGRQIKELEARAAKAKSVLLDRCRAQFTTNPTFKVNEFGECLYVSESFLEMSGWRYDQLDGLQWQRVIDPPDMPRLSVELFGAIDRKEDFSCSYAIRLNSWKRTLVHGTATPRYDMHGRFCGMTGVVFRID